MHYVSNISKNVHAGPNVSNYVSYSKMVKSRTFWMLCSSSAWRGSAPSPSHNITGRQRILNFLDGQESRNIPYFCHPKFTSDESVNFFHSQTIAKKQNEFVMSILDIFYFHAEKNYCMSFYIFLLKCSVNCCQC